jgi:hypothetical protein
MNENNFEIHRQLGINFKEGNSISEYDSGYDSSIFDLQPTDIFWSFSEIETNLIIAGVGKLNSGLQIPIGFSIDSDFPVNISIDDKKNLQGYSISLADLVTGQIVNLDSKLELNLAKGTYEDRFLLVLEDQESLAVEVATSRDEFQLYLDRPEKMLVIKNRDVIKVELYSTTGLKILSYRGDTLDNDIKIDVKGVDNGVYVVKIYDSIEVISKKIILY